MDETCHDVNMNAELILNYKDTHPDGGIIELVVWQLPIPVPPTTHSYKYRLVYIRNGVRIVGFDNERGKGDHMHLDGVHVALCVRQHRSTC